MYDSLRDDRWNEAQLDLAKREREVLLRGDPDVARHRQPDAATVTGSLDQSDYWFWELFHGAEHESRCVQRSAIGRLRPRHGTPKLTTLKLRFAVSLHSLALLSSTKVHSRAEVFPVHRQDDDTDVVVGLQVAEVPCEEDLHVAIERVSGVRSVESQVCFWASDIMENGELGGSGGRVEAPR